MAESNLPESLIEGLRKLDCNFCTEEVLKELKRDRAHWITDENGAPKLFEGLLMLSFIDRFRNWTSQKLDELITLTDQWPTA